MTLPRRSRHRESGPPRGGAASARPALLLAAGTFLLLDLLYFRYLPFLGAPEIGVSRPELFAVTRLALAPSDLLPARRYDASQRGHLFGRYVILPEGVRDLDTDRLLAYPGAEPRMRGAFVSADEQRVMVLVGSERYHELSRPARKHELMNDLHLLTSKGELIPVARIKRDGRGEAGGEDGAARAFFVENAGWDAKGSFYFRRHLRAGRTPELYRVDFLAGSSAPPGDEP